MKGFFYKLAINLTSMLLISTPAFATEPAAQVIPDAPMGYGLLLLRMMLMLGVVCGLAFISLRWGLKRFVDSGSNTRALHVVARLPLEPKRSLLVVRVASRHLLIGTSEAGLTNLGELSPEDADSLFPEEPRGATKASKKPFSSWLHQKSK
ncbi:MAG: FliO/MopB family protein [Bradymonadaceae bacterium]